MAATFVRGGTFLTTEGDSPRSVTIDCTGGDFLVVRLIEDGLGALGAPSFNGSAMTAAGTIGSLYQFVLGAPTQASATLSLPISDTYGRVQGEWEVWTDTDPAGRYGTPFSSSGTSAAPSVTPTDPSAGNANSAGVWHNYSTSMTVAAGTAVSTAAYNGGSGFRVWGAYRSDAGALGFTSGDSSGWHMLGLPIIGATGGAATSNPPPGRRFFLPILNH